MVLFCLLVSAGPSRSLPVVSPRLSQVDWSSYHEREPQGPGTYNFGYDIEDPATGNIQFRQEERFPNGTVEGSYGSVQPDGNIQVVHYVADHLGYRARIENSLRRHENFPPDVAQSSHLQSAITSQAAGPTPIHEQHVRPISNHLHLTPNHQPISNQLQVRRTISNQLHLTPNLQPISNQLQVRRPISNHLHLTPNLQPISNQLHLKYNRQPISTPHSTYNSNIHPISYQLHLNSNLQTIGNHHLPSKLQQLRLTSNVKPFNHNDQARPNVQPFNHQNQLKPNVRPFNSQNYARPNVRPINKQYPFEHIHSPSSVIPTYLTSFYHNSNNYI